MKPRKEILLTALLATGMLPNILQSSDVMTPNEMKQNIEEHGLNVFLEEVDKVLRDKNIDLDDLIDANWPEEIAKDFISCRSDALSNKSNLEKGFFYAVNDCINTKEELREIDSNKVVKLNSYKTKL